MFDVSFLWIQSRSVMTEKEQCMFLLMDEMRDRLIVWKQSSHSNFTKNWAMWCRKLPTFSSLMASSWLSFQFLTHWGQNKMANNLQTTFSNESSWMKMLELLFKCHCNLFPRVQLTIYQHLFRQWLGAEQATSYYLKQWWHGSWMH